MSGWGLALLAVSSDGDLGRGRMEELGSRNQTGEKSK